MAEGVLLLQGAGSMPGRLWPWCLRGLAYLLLKGQEPVQVGLELISTGLHHQQLFLLLREGAAHVLLSFFQF